MKEIDWEQVQAFAENNIFLVFAACIVLLSFLIFLLSLSIRSSRKKKEKRRKEAQLPLDERSLSQVIEKLKAASINTNLFITQHEAVLRAKEEELVSKDTAIKNLEERIVALNAEIEGKGGVPMVLTENNLWADPQLIMIWKTRVRRRLNVVLLTGVVIGLVLGNLIFYLVLTQTRLLEIFIERLANGFGF
jgi:hypothetical protein